jgi:murein DD-endopeptidase MepM/ murein hydrolase activator NlpD
MTKELLEIKTLPPELQYRIWIARERRKLIHDWTCALLCAAMAATVAIRPLNEWLDKVIPVGQPAVVKPKAPAAKAPAAKAPAPSDWGPKVKTGDYLGKGLRAGQRGFSLSAIHPITGKVRPHRGQDVSAPYGMPLYPVTRGKGATVKCFYEAGGAGHYAVITPDSDKGVTFLTMHLAPNSCRPGYRKRGEIIGNVASTGASTGPHIHFEYRINNQAVPPKVGQLKQHINGN